MSGDAFGHHELALDAAIILRLLVLCSAMNALAVEWNQRSHTALLKSRVNLVFYIIARVLGNATLNISKDFVITVTTYEVIHVCFKPI